MKLDEAIRSAHALADALGARLGACLLADSVGDDSMWLFAFDIIDGPKDWCWSVLVGSWENDTIYATNNRPDGIRL